jgi:SecD/SecF fusion protein
MRSPSRGPGGGLAAVLGIVAMVSFVSAGLGPNILQLEDFKINLPMIAAFLTIVGYSLNDTIVVFDRVREVRGKNPALTEQMIDTSLNQTLSRTLLTSLTTWFVVGILYFIGGAGIHGFAFCLVMGVIVGTYSSIYVASPVLLWLMNRETKTTKRPAETQTTKAAAAG